jgi:hypothetical protein
MKSYGLKGTELTPYPQGVACFVFEGVACSCTCHGVGTVAKVPFMVLSGSAWYKIAPVITLDCARNRMGINSHTNNRSRLQADCRSKLAQAV